MVAVAFHEDRHAQQSTGQLSIARSQIGEHERLARALCSTWMRSTYSRTTDWLHFGLWLTLKLGGAGGVLFSLPTPAILSATTVMAPNTTIKSMNLMHLQAYLSSVDLFLRSISSSIISHSLWSERPLLWSSTTLGLTHNLVSDSDAQQDSILTFSNHS